MRAFWPLPKGLIISSGCEFYSSEKPKNGPILFTKWPHLDHFRKWHWYNFSSFGSIKSPSSIQSKQEFCQVKLEFFL